VKLFAPDTDPDDDDEENNIEKIVPKIKHPIPK
jgi:hypothetical protein